MNRDTRIKKIQDVMKQDPFGKQEIPWEDALQSMNVYKVPLEYLVYNKYNGRILSRTKSLENQKHEIDVESENGRKLIEKLLWDSKPIRNKQTLESIEKFGQEKVGIITRDGIIIDGNRRAMMLGRTDRYSYFKAVILPVTLEEKPIEIEKLETSYQMGEDEKLGYNPIEKYLKASGLEKRGVSIVNIAKWMGEEETIIREYLAVMKTMDDYLDYVGYGGIYTQLDGREDQIIKLTQWLDNFYGEESAKAFDGYKNSDVDDLKMISFDYIRVVYNGQRFRNIAYGLKENHFFGDKKIWQDFRDFHFDHIEPIKDAEEKVDYDSENLEAHLNDRDNKFFEKGKNFLDENIDTHVQQLRYKQAANQPLKLVNNAIGALEAIDRRHRAFSAPEVLERIENLNQTTVDMLQNKSPERLLSQIVHLLESIKFGDGSSSKDELLKKIKEIEKIAYQLEKKVKDL